MYSIFIMFDFKWLFVIGIFKFVLSGFGLLLWILNDIEYLKIFLEFDVKISFEKLDFL